jgi:hypothetical protein
VAIFKAATDHGLSPLLAFGKALAFQGLRQGLK